MKILLVEDEAAMVDLLRRFLEPISSRIDSADDLGDAIRLASVSDYDVVFLDLKLVRTGKREALSAIPEFKKYKSAVIVVSGMLDEGLKEEVIEAGADAFVPKDCDFNSLAILVATNIATLRLPERAHKSDTYQSHVEMLRKMCEAA